MFASGPAQGSAKSYEKSTSAHWHSGQDVDMSDVFYTHKLFTVSPTPMSI